MNSIELRLVPKDSGKNKRRVPPTALPVTRSIDLVDQNGSLTLRVNPSGRISARSDEVYLFSEAILPSTTEVIDEVPYHVVKLSAGARVTSLFLNRANHIVYDGQQFGVATVENKAPNRKKERAYEN